MSAVLEGVKLSSDLNEAVSQVMENMLGINVQIRGEYEGTPKRFKADVSAMIGLTCPGLSGTAMLHCNEDLARQLAGVMLGEEIKPGGEDGPSEELRDAIGELTNIIVGNFKTTLSKHYGQTVQMSVPAVVLGSAHSTRSLAGADWLAIEFEVGGQCLVLEFCVGKGKNGG